MLSDEAHRAPRSADDGVDAVYHAAMTSITFLHSADWQLGMTRRFLGPESQAVYTADRLAAVGALGRHAVEHDARFVVVAGDVFEDNAVPRSVVLRAAEVLADFPVPVYLLPGNHDPLDVSSVFGCADFARATSGGRVHVLDGTDPIEVEPGVELVGVPWTSKRPDPSRLPTLLDRLEPSRGLRVLCVHGGTDEVYGGRTPSVEALPVALLEEAVSDGRVDYVALGDRHSLTRVGTGDRIWYPGSPETTAFDDVEGDPGHALVVRLDRVDGAGVDRPGCTTTPVDTGRWRFLALSAEVDTEEDFRAFSERVEALPDKPRTVVKIALTGTVGVALRAAIDEQLDRWSQVFAAAYLRASRTDLVVRAEDTDFAGLLDGYAGRAVADLVELAASPDPEAQDAGYALSLLYRLVGGERR